MGQTLIGALLGPPSYVFSKQIESVTKRSWEVYSTCSFGVIGIDSAGCRFHQALYRATKVIETVYPLARCAKFDTLDFSCAAASIADPPPLFIHLHVSGYFNPPGTLGGEEIKEEGGRG